MGSHLTPPSASVGRYRYPDSPCSGIRERRQGRFAAGRRRPCRHRSETGGGRSAPRAGLFLILQLHIPSTALRANEMPSRASRETHGMVIFARSPRAHTEKSDCCCQASRRRPSGELCAFSPATPGYAGCPGGTVMTASATSTKLPLEPPGPGSWEQDPVHFPRPMTRYFQETHPPAFEKGTSEFARLYGMLTGGLRMRYVEGFGYRQVLPAPEAEIPERLQRTEQVLARQI